MDREIFAAGVAHGAPTTISEVKMMVCRMLELADNPVSFGLLHEAAREYELVNYFELITALSQLCETGHIKKIDENGVDYYTIGELGLEASRELSRSLPASVREKAELSIRRALSRERRLSEVKAEATPYNGGWLLTMSLPDQSSDLISFTVFAPSKQECDKMRRGFLNDPLFIYKSVMALLSGRRDVLGAPLPEGEKLF